MKLFLNLLGIICDSWSSKFSRCVKFQSKVGIFLLTEINSSNSEYSVLAICGNSFSLLNIELPINTSLFSLTKSEDHDTAGAKSLNLCSALILFDTYFL